jgi:hypothetical protein
LEATADVAFPEKKHIVSKIGLSIITVGRRIQELPNEEERILKMKADNFQWSPIAMEKSTNVSVTAQFDVSFVEATGISYNSGSFCLNVYERDHYRCQEDGAKSGYSNTETGWSANYCREEQRRVFACHQRHEECYE